MAFPKIQYISGGNLVTLQFQRPPRKVPAYSMVATRHDNIASSGVRESILERIDNFLEFDMEWVASGADVQAWQAFMAYALAGGQFTYYPDASQPAYQNYWLEGTTWDASYKAPGQYSFKVKFRQVVA